MPQMILSSLYIPPLYGQYLYGNNTFQKGASLSMRRMTPISWFGLKNECCKIVYMGRDVGESWSSHGSLLQHPIKSFTFQLEVSPNQRYTIYVYYTCFQVFFHVVFPDFASGTISPLGVPRKRPFHQFLMTSTLLSFPTFQTNVISSRSKNSADN